MEEQTSRGFAKKGDLDKLLLPFLTWDAASALECAYLLSFFYIFDSLLLAPLPAATGRTGRRAETVIPCRFVPPCTTGLRARRDPGGG